MPTMYVGLGTNKGNRSEQLSRARGHCCHFFGPLLAVSPVYETAAWGVEDQPDFLNQVIALQTDVKPSVAIYTLLAIENLMGRVRSQKWGPRVIDVDMLYYDDQIINTQDLILPHPRIAQRQFVLTPLASIAPDFVDPQSGKTITEMMRNCSDSQAVTLFNGADQ